MCLIFIVISCVTEDSRSHISSCILSDLHSLVQGRYYAPGHGAPAEVLVGAHRDAWVFGAVDPHSGSAVLLELAFVLGSLMKQGWVPDRTIRLCSWDAEESG